MSFLVSLLFGIVIGGQGMAWLNNAAPRQGTVEVERQPLFESGAILGYLAERSGMLLPPAGPARWAVVEWL